MHRQEAQFGTNTGSGGLEGKSALITGGNSGIGRAIAERMAADGARVTVVDRDVSSFPKGSEIKAIQANVADPEAMARAVEVAAEGGRLDICVANAGVFTEYEGFVDAAVEEWDRLFRVNLLGVMVTFQAAVRRMLEDDDGGRLLATSSAAGVRGEAGWPAYCASKAGVIKVVESLAIELGPKGITINAVAPGEVDTPMHRRVAEERSGRLGRGDQAATGLLKPSVPLQRLGTPEDVAALFAFLASEQASYITGQTLAVDGGALLV
jgi:NAD(P)-dependent dehydrogenase (short-subunit alcohol dehydrogenase family)